MGPPTKEPQIFFLKQKLHKPRVRSDTSTWEVDSGEPECKVIWAAQQAPGCPGLLCLSTKGGGGTDGNDGGKKGMGEGREAMR